MPTTYPEMYVFALIAFAAILTAVGTIFLGFLVVLYIAMFIKRLRYFYVNRSSLRDGETVIKLAAVYAWGDIWP